MSRLRDTLAALPGDALVPVRWLLAQLESPTSPDAGLAGRDLSVAAFARVVGRSAAQVRTWCVRGLVRGAYRLPGTKRPGAWRIPRAAVEAFRAQQSPAVVTTSPEPEPAPPTSKRDIRAWRSVRRRRA
jgi:hypothetical protein